MTGVPTGPASSAATPDAETVAAGRLVRFCLKELREILRDRRTIVTLVLMPLLVYPLLSILFNKLLSMPRKRQGSTSAIVGVEGSKGEEECSASTYPVAGTGVAWREQTSAR